MPKVKSSGKLNQTAQSGFSSVEILIAFAIFVISITAIILLSFGNQSVALDIVTNNEALVLANKQIEQARAQARTGFNTLADTSGTEDIYNTDLKISDVTICRKDIISTVTWPVSPIRTQTIQVSSSVGDLSVLDLVGNDCSATGPNTPWKFPATFTSRDIGPPIGPNSGIAATDIDVLKINGQKLAFLSSRHSTNVVEDLWIFNVNVGMGVDPIFVGKLDTGIGDGANALDVVQIGDKFYAFLAAAGPTNQYQIVDLTDPTSPALLASIDLGVSGMYPEATSIYFYDNKVYVGTHRTAGPEFHVFDFNPADPANPAPAHYTLELNHNVNKIRVRDGEAYLATSADLCELIVIDVSNPASLSNPCPAGGGTSNVFNTPGEVSGGPGGNDHGDGTSLFLIGQKVYLGRSNTSDYELYVLDISDLTNIIALGQAELAMTPSSAAVRAISVSGDLAFLGTSDSNQEFQVWNIADPTNIQMCSDFNFPQEASGIEFFEDKVYASVRSNNALHIIFDNPPAP